jgi:two-component system OmpR family response regulator
VVDDDPGIRRLVGDFLRLLGCVVHLAADGREALEHLQHTRPDLILLDLMMPVMDGRALGTALRGDERTVDLPIVLMSGAAEAAQVGGEIRAQAVLRKPFELAELARVVEQAR